MKKVLILTHSFPNLKHPAKAIFVQDELLLLNNEASFKVLLVNTYLENVKQNHLLGENKFGIEKLGYFSLPIQKIKLKKGFYISKKLKNHINFSEYDLVHAHFLVPSGLAVPYLKKPSVITIHGSDWNLYKNNQKWLPVIKNTLTNASAVVTVSNALKTDIVRIFPELSEKIYPIPHAIDPFWLETLLINDKKNECIKIITVASLKPIKGILYLIKALNKLEYSGPIELTIFSIEADQDYKVQVEKEIEKLPNTIKIVFKGESSRETIRQTYMQASFAVLPSLKEGFGLSIIEANACGLPVISTKSGGPESIIEKENGLLVEPANHIQLANAIRNMIDKLPDTNSGRIRKFIQNKFPALEKKKKILEVYKKVAG